MRRFSLALTGAVALPAVATAQVAGFQTPGMPKNWGQTDQFTTSFNPAIGGVIDVSGDYLTMDSGRDGFDVQFRSFELNMHAWVDPSAWMYVVLNAGEEEIALEEAAVIYQGFGNNMSLKAGRFFADFGKLMQAHEHDLNTLERPAVLREYLGEELPGVGLQFDDFFFAGDETVVRYSVGGFARLGGEGHHGEEEDDDDGGPEELTRQRLEGDELGATARLTAFTDVGENGVLQGGLSVRLAPEFDYELDGIDSQSGRTTAYGADLTYGWASDTGIQTFTTGVEALILDGDIAAGTIDPTPNMPLSGDETVRTVDDTAFGFYAYADYGWSRSDNVGVQVSRLQRAEAGTPYTTEYDLYYTKTFTEFQRVRFDLTFVDAERADDSIRAAIQYTVFIGSHAHAVNF